jgi:hypothetical protein
MKIGRETMKAKIRQTYISLQQNYELGMNRIKFITYFLNRLSLSSARLVKYWRSASIQNQNEQEHEQIPLLIQDHLRPAIVLLCTSGFTEVNFHVIS